MNDVRPATEDDLPAWVRVLREVSPYLVTSATAVRHDTLTIDNLARLVATDRNEVVGIARVRRRGDHESQVVVQLQVRTTHRRRGHGRALLDRALETAATAAATEVSGIAQTDGGTVAAIASWGFRINHEHTLSAVDPRTVPPLVAPTGYRVSDLSTVGPRAVWDCYQATARDDPSGLSLPEPFEEFLAVDWQDPLQRPELGRAVLSTGSAGTAGAVAAFAVVTTSEDRAWNTFTGTHPDFRGRGLATLAKSHSLRALAADGITVCGTGNDATNAAMLAVNTRLGYRPTATTYGVSRRI